MGCLIRWYMGDGSIVRLVAEIDKDDMNNVPDRVYKDSINGKNYKFDVV